MMILSVGGEPIAAPENLHLIRILRAPATGVPFTIISDREDAQDIAAAIRIEAQGFINSGMDPWLAHRRTIIHSQWWLIFLTICDASISDGAKSGG